MVPHRPAWRRPASRCGAGSCARPARPRRDEAFATHPDLIRTTTDLLPDLGSSVLTARAYLAGPDHRRPVEVVIADAPFVEGAAAEGARGVRTL